MQLTITNSLPITEFPYNEGYNCLQYLSNSSTQIIIYLTTKMYLHVWILKYNKHTFANCNYFAVWIARQLFCIFHDYRSFCVLVTKCSVLFRHSQSKLVTRQDTNQFGNGVFKTELLINISTNK